MPCNKKAGFVSGIEFGRDRQAVVIVGHDAFLPWLGIDAYADRSVGKIDRRYAEFGDLIGPTGRAGSVMADVRVASAYTDKQASFLFE